MQLLSRWICILNSRNKQSGMWSCYSICQRDNSGVHAHTHTYTENIYFTCKFVTLCMSTSKLARIREIYTEQATERLLMPHIISSYATNMDMYMWDSASAHVSSSVLDNHIVHDKCGACMLCTNAEDFRFARIQFVWNWLLPNICRDRCRTNGANLKVASYFNRNYYIRWSVW